MAPPTHILLVSGSTRTSSTNSAALHAVLAVLHAFADEVGAIPRAGA